MRALGLCFAVSVVLVTSAVVPATSAAQTLDPAAFPDPSLIDPEELASIDTQADVATALYVAGLILHIGGVGAAVGTTIATFCISFSGSCPPSPSVLVVSSWIGSGVGLVMFLTAIGLDVDSGLRRKRLFEDAGFYVSVAPLEGGGVVSVQRRF